MKFNLIFTQYLNCKNSNEVFSYFQKTLKDSITSWDYFVNWQKVCQNFKDIEIELNILNFLIGKSDIENEARLLFRKYPNVASVIPLLIASRDLEFKILTNYQQGNLIYDWFSFDIENNKITEYQIEKIIDFLKFTKLLDILRNGQIQSVPDYVFGIEVGLDSNGRKNRGGSTMEKIVYSILFPICNHYNFLIMQQATAQKLKQRWNIKLKIDKSSRRFDFAVKTNHNLYLIETNFYGGGGSKLKATAGEYKSLFDYLSSQGYKLIWITDGLGWQTAINPLQETFNYIDYTLNLNMVTTGLLSAIITQEL